MKLSTMGFFIRATLTASIAMSMTFSVFYAYYAFHICDFASSNAVTLFSFTAALLFSGIILAPKLLLKYRFVFYEILIIAAGSNAIMLLVGPGTCFPLLTDSIKYAHGLTAFAFLISLLLILASPSSNLGILKYSDEEPEKLPSSNRTIEESQ